MKTRLGFFLAFVSMLILTGCAAGTDFIRVADLELALGKTTFDDIKTRMGREPYQISFDTKNERKLKLASYQYSSRLGGEPRVPGITPGRAQIFIFADDILVGHVFVSSFKEDSTWFEDRDVLILKEGETTRAQVIDLFGEPDGFFIHPLVEDENVTAIVYSYTQLSTSGLSINRWQKDLVISFDEDGVVTEVTYTDDRSP